MKKEIEKRIDDLIRLIRYYDFCYFIKSQKKISDFEYDKLREELEILEKEFPCLIREDSPSFSVGPSSPSNKKIERKVPMLSLKKTYEKKELCKFAKNFFPEKMILEPKIDGVSAAIIYKNHIIDSFSLRGNGFLGEDISSKAPLIRGIPLKIECFSNVEIRGEVFIYKINGEENLRNVAAGFLRRKSNEKININFIAYSLINETINTQEESLEILKKEFEIPDFRIINNEDELLESIKIFQEKERDYETDGIVLKSNNLNNADFSKRYSSNAMAFKWAGKTFKTIVNNINWPISRRGIFTPVIEVEPPKDAPKKIKNISISNKKKLESFKIGIGSKVLITLAGSIIPQIVEVLNEKSYVFLSKCPYCQSQIVENEINFMCINKNCSGINFEKIKYFFEKLDIKGLSIQTLERFKNNNILEIINILKETNWILDINDRKIYEEFNNKRKNFKWKDIIIALGVENVSEKFLEKINEKDEIKIDQKKYNNLKNFLEYNKNLINDIKLALIK